MNLPPPCRPTAFVLLSRTRNMMKATLALVAVENHIPLAPSSPGLRLGQIYRSLVWVMSHLSRNRPSCVIAPICFRRAEASSLDVNPS